MRKCPSQPLGVVLKQWTIIPEPTARSAVPGVSPGRGLLIRTAIYTRGKRQHSGFKSGCHRRVGGHLTDLKNMDVYQEWERQKYQKIHVRKLKNCFTHDAKHLF